MAEFVRTDNQARQTADDAALADGFNSMGKPIPALRRETGAQHARDMGITDKEKVTGLVGRMSEALERDKPYEAMEAGMAYLDLTGTYRMMAVLLTAPKPRVRIRAATS